MSTIPLCLSVKTCARSSADRAGGFGPNTPERCASSVGCRAKQVGFSAVTATASRTSVGARNIDSCSVDAPDADSSGLAAGKLLPCGVTTERQPLVGNRWALAGVIIYFGEWVGIVAFSIGNVPASQGTKAAEILAQYAQHATAVELLAGWLSLVLLGRILFVAGIRDALRKSGAETLLADFALVAMAVSVIVEISAWTVAAGGAYAAANGADQSTIVGIDALANFLTQVIGAPLAASILAGSVATLRSRLFPAWLCWVGLVAGVLGCVYGVIAGAAFAAGGACASALCLTGSALPGLAQLISVALLGVWIWMIGTGVVLFRAAGRQRSQSAA